MEKEEEKKEPVFECRKCGHLVFLSSGELEKLLEKECDYCGEQPERLWIFVRFGNYDKEYGIKP
jgi:hypothetical protein